MQVFFIRGGKIIGRENFILQGTASEEPPQIMTSFVKQFYTSAPYIPPLILLQHPVEDIKTIESWLQSKRGGKVEIRVPHRGNKKQLVDIVAENARQGLEQLKIKQMATPELSAAIAEVEKELHLPRTPMRMEGYDISNIQGKMAVGSMVVFENGKPKPAHYRRFKIKTVAGANDYAMLEEVLKRRFKHVSDAADRWPNPDLILIDGGKGQLNAALSALKETGADIPVASLAKENEEIFVPESPKPIVLPRSFPGTPAYYSASGMSRTDLPWAITRKCISRKPSPQPLILYRGLGPNASVPCSGGSARFRLSARLLWKN